VSDKPKKERDLKAEAEARLEKVKDVFEKLQKQREQLVMNLQKLDNELVLLQGEHRALTVLVKEEKDGEQPELQDVGS